MRTNRQQLYDKIYLLGDIWVLNRFLNFRAWRKQVGKRAAPEFLKIYREEILPYWKQFGRHPKKLWFRHYYNTLGTIGPRYIPDDIHCRYIVPFFDNPLYERQLEDKNLYSMVFPDVKRPETVFKYFGPTYFSARAVGFCNEDFTPITRQEAIDRLSAGGRFILKPTRDTGEGKDIRVFTAGEGGEDIPALLDSYKGVDFIVQRFVSQHPDLAAFNASSLNTIRLITMVWEGQPRILSGIIRIGSAGNPVDNIAAGGYQVGIDTDTGTLKKQAFTYAGGIGAEQTAEGKVFGGFPIPSWEKLRDTAMQCALRLPHLKLIGWDFAIDEKGDVVLIELNCHFGQTQSSNGPTFGDLTEEVLTAVFGRR